MVRPTAAEIAAAMPGDELVPHADVVMDRAFTVPGPPDAVWPWIQQLGKSRAGWYLPRSVERMIPRSHRGIRSIDVRWQALQVADVVPDYGGSAATFDVAIIKAPTTLVYTSRRGRTSVSWAITLTAVGDGTRIRLRLRLSPVGHRWLANSLGAGFDLVTIAGMAAGLRERVSPGA